MRALTFVSFSWLLAGAAVAQDMAASPPVVATPPSRSSQATLTTQSRAAEASTATGLVVGDSIAALFPAALLEQSIGGVWANFGNPGDTTENTLWRLNQIGHGSARWHDALLLLGVNNLWRDEPERIAAGIVANVRRLHQIAPHAAVGVVSVLPFGPDLARAREKVVQLNRKLADAAGPERYIFIDAYAAFLAACSGGKGTCGLLRDELHPGERGYELLARSIREAWGPAPRGTRTP
ncbi:MAG: SGNH/GDSL hydrolase family protein [Geminicoccaceae bacterium]